MQKKRFIIAICALLVLCAGTFLACSNNKTETSSSNTEHKETEASNKENKQSDKKADNQEEAAIPKEVKKDQETQKSEETPTPEEPKAPVSHMIPAADRFGGDPTSINNTTKNWGQGSNVDDLKRPTGSISNQELYGKYGADFIQTNENKIYLTIDEGYENGYTKDILDVLKEKNCPAVFFVTLPYVKENPDLIRRMIDEGHVVGNHSVTHPAKGMPSVSIEQQKNELMELHQYVLDNFQYEMYLFRYPAGIFSEQSLAVINSLGYRSIFWSFAYRDWIVDDQPAPADALETLNNKIHPGAVYLLHAVSKTNTEVMGTFIDNVRSKGYEPAKYE